MLTKDEQAEILKMVRSLCRLSAARTVHNERAKRTADVQYPKKKIKRAWDTLRDYLKELG